MNKPYFIEAPWNVIDSPEKSTPPKITPIIGIMMLSTKLETILLKAPPIITPTAKSTTFPFDINCLNSSKKKFFHIYSLLYFFFF